MLIRFLLASSLVAGTFGLAYAESFVAKITKVEGTKITFQKCLVSADGVLSFDNPATSDIIADAPVTQNRLGYPDGRPVATALPKTINPEKGRIANLTRADAGANTGKITAIQLTEETFGAKILKVDGNKVTFRRIATVADRGIRSFEPMTIETIKDVPVLRIVQEIDSGKGKFLPSERLSLADKMFQQLDDKALRFNLITADFGKEGIKIIEIQKRETKIIK